MPQQIQANAILSQGERGVAGVSVFGSVRTAPSGRRSGVVLMMMGRRRMQLCITYYACAAFDFLNLWYNVSAVL